MAVQCSAVHRCWNSKRRTATAPPARSPPLPCTPLPCTVLATRSLTHVGVEEERGALSVGEEVQVNGWIVRPTGWGRDGGRESDRIVRRSPPFTHRSTALHCHCCHRPTHHRTCFDTSNHSPPPPSILHLDPLVWTVQRTRSDPAAANPRLLEWLRCASPLATRRQSPAAVAALHFDCSFTPTRTTADPTRSSSLRPSVAPGPRPPTLTPLARVTLPVGQPSSP